MRIPPKRKFWITVAVASLSAVAMAAVALLAVRLIAANWALIASSERERMAIERGRDDAAAVGRALELLRAETDEIKAGFADPKSPLPFIETIEELGKRSGLKVDLALGSGSGSGAGGYMLRAEGSFRGIFAFLGHLEALPFLAELGNAEIVRVSGGDQEAPSKGSSKAPPEPLLRLALSLGIVTP